MKRLFFLGTFVLLFAVCSYSQSLFERTLHSTQPKPNDYLIAKIKNPTCGAAAFKYHELTVDNTRLLTKDEYRNTQFVKKEFTKDGRFDEAEWNRFYELLLDEWIRFCYWGYKECAELEIIYSQSDILRPIDVKVIHCHGCTFWKKIE